MLKKSPLMIKLSTFIPLILAWLVLVLLLMIGSTIMDKITADKQRAILRAESEFIEDYHINTVVDGPVIAIPNSRYYELTVWESDDPNQRIDYSVSNQQTNFSAADFEDAQMKVLFFQTYVDGNDPQPNYAAFEFSNLENTLKAHGIDKPLVTYYIETNPRPIGSIYADKHITQAQNLKRTRATQGKLKEDVIGKLRILTPYGRPKLVRQYYQRYFSKLNKLAKHPHNVYDNRFSGVVVLLNASNQITTVFTHRSIPVVRDLNNRVNEPVLGINTLALGLRILEYFKLPNPIASMKKRSEPTFGDFRGGIQMKYLTGSQFSVNELNDDALNWVSSSLLNGGLNADIHQAKQALTETLDTFKQEPAE